jgi:hypothetical protein
LAGSDSLKLGNLKDTAQFDLNLIGTAPFTVFVLKSNGDTLKIRNVKNNKLLLPRPDRGSFEILSAIDSLGLRSNVISKKLKVGYDTISYINYTTEKICGQNYFQQLTQIHWQNNFYLTKVLYDYFINSFATYDCSLNFLKDLTKNDHFTLWLEWCQFVAFKHLVA